MTDQKELTAYEAQVLIGTSISGCAMPPDRVFDLSAAWERLYALGLIDRTDGLAVATPEGVARISSMLALASLSASVGVTVKPLTWEQPDGPGGTAWLGHGFDQCQYYTRLDKGEWIVPGDAHGDAECETFATIDAAKAYCQADYEARIRSALSLPSSGGEVVARRYRLRSGWQYMTEEPGYFAAPRTRDDYEIEPLYARATESGK